MGIGIEHGQYPANLWEQAAASTGTAFTVITQDGQQVVTQAGERVITQAEIHYVFTQAGNRVVTQNGEWVTLQ